MIWYIAFVALLNLGLGYGLARMLGVSRSRVVTLVGPHSAEEHGDY